MSNIYPHNCSPMRKLFIDHWKYHLVGKYRNNDNLETAAEYLNKLIIEKTNIKQTEKVLYFSCGFGENSSECAKLTGSNVSQIYKNTWRILRAKDINKESSVNWFKGYLDEQPSETYDCVVVNETISDFKNELEQIHRILKPKGKLALSPLTTIDIDDIINNLVGNYKFEKPEYILEETNKLFDIEEVDYFNESCYNTYKELYTIFQDSDDIYQNHFYQNFYNRCVLVERGLWGKLLLFGTKK